MSKLATGVKSKQLNVSSQQIQPIYPNEHLNKKGTAETLAKYIILYIYIYNVLQ